MNTPQSKSMRPGLMAAIALGLLLPCVCEAQAVLDRPISTSVRLSPATELASEPPVGDASSLLRTASILVLVIAATGLVLGVARRFWPGLAPYAGKRPIRILSQTALGPKASVYLLHCGPRVLIVGVTAQQTTTLAEIADPGDIDECLRLADPTATLPAPQSDAGSEANPIGLQNQLRTMIHKVEAWKT